MLVYLKQFMVKGKWVHVSSLQEASKYVRSYITEHALGASTWDGGSVKDQQTNQVIAKVSYNGRIWDLTGKEIN